MLKLGDVEVIIGNLSVVLPQLPTLFTLNFPPGVTLDDRVTAYGAVVSQEQELVKLGDYVCITSDGTEVRRNYIRQHLNVLCVT